MINYLDVLFFTAISVVGVAGFTIATALIIDIGAKKKPIIKLKKMILILFINGSVAASKAIKRINLKKTKIRLYS